MNFGEFIVTEIKAGIAVRLEMADQGRSVIGSAHLNAHKNVGLVSSSHSIGKFSEAAICE